MNRASRARRPNALDHLDSSDVTFVNLHQAALQQQELHIIALAIADSTTALA
jgi:hypothetical protein